MEAQDVDKLVAARDVLAAQETLEALSISGYPHLKREAASKLHREVYRKAYPDAFDKPRPMTGADLARMLNG